MGTAAVALIDAAIVRVGSVAVAEWVCGAKVCEQIWRVALEANVDLREREREETKAGVAIFD